MGLYDIIDEITERQVTKTETGDNRIWGVMVGIVAKNYDPNSSGGGGTGSNSGADAMDGRVCVTIPTRDTEANELKWARGHALRRQKVGPLFPAGGWRSGVVGL